jgi:hypothetical protein
MRSTLTLEDTLDKQVRILAEREHLSYKDAVNLCLGKGLERLMAAEKPQEYQINPFSAGLQAGIDAEKLNQVLDDPELDA